MAEWPAQDVTEHLRAAFDEALRGSPDLPARTRAAFRRLADVLEANADAITFP